jgi:A/G-specific adenine glycosylase
MQGICIARRDGRQDQLPAAKVKKVVQERETTMLLLNDGQRVWLERRPPTGIWGGLLAPPEAEEHAIDGYLRRCGARLVGMQALPLLKHRFTHFRLTIRPVWCAVEVMPWVAAEPGGEWLNLNDIKSAALPTPVLKLLSQVPPLQAAPVLDLQAYGVCAYSPAGKTLQKRSTSG